MSNKEMKNVGVVVKWAVKRKKKSLSELGSNVIGTKLWVEELINSKKKYIN